MKNKIKYLFGVALALPLVSMRLDAQTNLLGSLAQPVNVIGDYLSANTNALTATNWTVAPYGTYCSSLTNRWGGGLAAVYYLTPYVGTQIRMQYLDTGSAVGSRVWLPNGTLTLQSVYRPFGENIPLTVRPVIEAGMATDLSGRMYAIAGGGGEVDIYTWNLGNRMRRISLLYGREQWQGNNSKLTPQQFGAALNFNLGGKGFLGLF